MMVIENGNDVEHTEDSAIQEKKHVEKLERLAAMNEVRLQESAARKSSAVAASDPRESVDLFLSSFSQKREAVELGLALASKKVTEASSLKEHLENLSLEVTAMEKLVAGAAYFLPAFVVKASQNSALKLRDELEVANAELVPKKKFSFRNKLKKPVDSVPSFTQGIPESISGEQARDDVGRSSGLFSCAVQNSEEYSDSEVDPAVQGDYNSSKPGAIKNLSSQPLPQVSTVNGANNAQLINGHVNTTFVRSGGELEGELTISNLTNCKVYLKGRLTTLIVHSLKNCHVYAGPITGSAFIEHVQDSVLVLASHQIRIHSTSNTDFYLRVRSGPIVEYTSGNRFAPYAFYYNGILDDLYNANLAEETGLWGKVADFRWLRAVASPNWSFIPVEDRVPIEDGSNVVGLRCNESSKEDS